MDSSKNLQHPQHSPNDKRDVSNVGRHNFKETDKVVSFVSALNSKKRLLAERSISKKAQELGW